MRSRQTDAPNHARRRGKLRFLFLTLLIVGGATALLLPFLLIRTMMSGTSLQTDNQFELASPNSRGDIALEVTSLPSSTLLTGTLLQKTTNDSYKRTNQKVTVQWNASQLVMGKRSDIKEGAVLQVGGRVGNDGVLIASQV